MSRGDFGYRSTSQPYRDDPSQREYRDNPFNRGNTGYQGSEYDSYNEIVDTVTSSIFTINSNATTLDQLMKDVGTNRDTVHLRDKIHGTEQRTNDIITSTVHSLKRLAALCDKRDREQWTQQSKLSGEFKECVKRYNTFQKKVAEKVKTCVILSSQSRSQPAKLVDWEDAGSDEQHLLENEQRRAQLMAEDESIETEVALLQEREQHIRQLETDVLDINEIFRDLGTMIHEQGEAIDSIDNNVQKASDDVESGREQLEKAAHYQRKARKKMCILVGVLLAIAGIIALIVALSVKKH